MSFLQILILGGFSGLTILLGLPIARLKPDAKKHIVFLNAIAIGILLFLFYDVLKNATEPIEVALNQHNIQQANLLIGALVIGFAVGLLSLVYYAQRFFLPAVASAKAGIKGGMPAEKLATLIAIGIGLHNFSEGLAIGNSARAGAAQLTLLLIIGFSLHNITEAFGIVMPLAGKAIRWTQLFLLGIIGGGPNIIGTLIGYSIISQPVSVLFLSLAAGALVFVIAELFNAGRKLGYHAWGGWGLTLGFLLGIGTDLFLTALGR